MKSDNNYKKERGKLGEQLAAKHLIEQGYEVLARNWRFYPYEIDIIARKDETIIFVEVKMREHFELMEAWESVSNGQQKRIIAAAHEYLVQNNIELESRFDIIGIKEVKGQFQIEHFEDAFYPS